MSRNSNENNLFPLFKSWDFFQRQFMVRSIITSCEPCRKRKRKCDGKMPCATCIKSRTGPSACFYLHQTETQSNDDLEYQEITTPSCTMIQTDNPMLSLIRKSLDCRGNQENAYSPNTLDLTKRIKISDESAEKLLPITEIRNSAGISVRPKLFSSQCSQSSNQNSKSSPAQVQTISNTFPVDLSHSNVLNIPCRETGDPTWQFSDSMHCFTNRKFAVNHFEKVTTNNSGRKDCEAGQQSSPKHDTFSKRSSLEYPRSDKQRIRESSQKNENGNIGDEDAIARLISILDENIQNHLRSLSFLFYCGVDVLQDLGYCIPMFRPDQITTSLANAMYYHATFFSNHPGLFRMKPTIKERTAIADRFAKNILKDYSILLYSQFSTNTEVCDNIRAILLHCTTCYLLYSYFEANELLGGCKFT
jgi:hypothetical protein